MAQKVLLCLILSNQLAQDGVVILSVAVRILTSESGLLEQTTTSLLRVSVTTISSLLEKPQTERTLQQCTVPY